jgi:hypothetical protein
MAATTPTYARKVSMMRGAIWHPRRGSVARSIDGVDNVSNRMAHQAWNAVRQESAMDKWISRNIIVRQSDVAERRRRCAVAEDERTETTHGLRREERGGLSLVEPGDFGEHGDGWEDE